MVLSLRLLLAVSQISAVIGADLASEYIWPSHNDFLETLLYEQFGRDVESASTFVAPCGMVNIGPGRSGPAEWIRTAFHDMATADVAAGTGGMDASIGFELDRAENPGGAFIETLENVRKHMSARSSMADMVTLGAIFSAGSCSNGRVIIPFRGGRIDATGPGPLGVPKPEEGIDSHTAAFKRLGFNREEMIGLVACGHTLGGVHGRDFPEIVDSSKTVPNDTEQQTQMFDKTNNGANSFDNTVAKEFMANSTQNPLAFGHNETTNSDGRIFSSDGRKTIKKLADSNDFFLQTCTKLMEKMLNTVPKTVNLTAPVMPIAVKPSRLYASILDNTNMNFTGQIRLIDQIDPDPNRSVQLRLRPRGAAADICTKTPKSCTLITAKADDDSWSASLYGAPPGQPFFKQYLFSTKIPISKGISSFDVIVNDKQKSGKVDSKTYINGGSGFPFDDTVLVQPGLSCAEQDVKGALKLTVAIRDDAKLNTLKGNVQLPSSVDVLVPSIQTKALKFVKAKGVAGSGYTFYTAQNTDYVGPYVRTYDLVASDGKRSIEKPFNELRGLQKC